MSEWIYSVVEHSRRELELLGLHQVGLDDVVVEFIKDLHTKLGNQPGAMKSIANYVNSSSIRNRLHPSPRPTLTKMVDVHAMNT